VKIYNEDKHPEDSEISDKILDVLLNDILYGYETLYEREDYWLIREASHEVLFASFPCQKF